MTATAASTALLFRLPDVGEGLVEAEILAWHVAVGDTVTDGQPVCEVETAKAAVELPVPYDGTVVEILQPTGATVAVGAPIIAVRPADGAGPAPAPAPEAVPEAVPEAAPAVLVGYGPRQDGAARPRRRSRGTGTGPGSGPGAAAGAGERPRAKPPVRKLARELGVDLAAVPHSGPDGIVTREDVLAAARPAAPAPEPEAVPAGGRDGEVRIPVRGVRKATAKAMVASAFTAPHVTEFIEVDMTRTLKLMRRLRASAAPEDPSPSPLLMVVAAYLAAVRRNPAVNASWDEPNQEIVVKEQVNLGIAAATERGLVVPNIKDAGRLTLEELARALRELVRTARAGRCTPADLTGGTTTVTNIGIFGVDGGTPLLNPGEAAILAFGAVRRKPWVHRGRLAVRDVTTLSLSFDHRLIDGELGSKVLADTAAALEHPDRLVLWR